MEGDSIQLTRMESKLIMRALRDYDKAEYEDEMAELHDKLVDFLSDGQGFESFHGIMVTVPAVERE